MHRPGPIRTKRKSFTLVELVIVVLILGILAAVGAPRFAASLRYHQAETAAQRIAADLRMAQQLAKTASSGRTVSFDVNLDSYSVFPDVDDFDHPGQPYSVSLSEAPYSAALVSADFDGDSSVTFNGYGAPDSGGQVVVASGDEQRRIRVDGDTGEITFGGNAFVEAEASQVGQL